MTAPFTIPNPVRFVLSRLQEAGYHAYCVGGCVRDHLMGRTPGDYDVTTNARPEELLRVFADVRLVETGLQHGTVTIVYGGMNIETTTYRIDGTYRDGRHPDDVTFTDRLADDLCRRDFTINAMAHAPGQGIVDLYGGQEDLQNRRIRCVGKAEERFAEDGLRILRALRFASVLDFTLEETCAAAVRSGMGLLQKISRERIAVELTKLLTGTGAARILHAYPEVIASVLPGVVPEDVTDAGDGLGRDTFFTERGEVPDAAMRYALLFRRLHDREARQAIDSLKPSRHEKNAILEYRTPAPANTVEDILLCMSRGEDETPARLTRYAALCGERTAEEAVQIAGQARRMVQENRVRRLDMLAVNGQDLTACGLRGRVIGETLTELLHAVLREELPNEKEALLRHIRRDGTAETPETAAGAEASRKESL